MSTGITVTDAAIDDFRAFKLSSNPVKYMILKIDGGSIVVENSSEDGDFDNIVAQLKDDDCRYVVYKRTIQFEDGRLSEKLVSISW
jgi:hypothetical protein